MPRTEIPQEPKRRGRPPKELHLSEVPIEQPSPIIGNEHSPEIIQAEQVLKQDYLAELAFNEEPVEIFLQPSNEKNAPTAYPVWVNGKPAEALFNGKWVEFNNGYIPVGVNITLKRKYVEVLINAKSTNVMTPENNPGQEAIGRPFNLLDRTTSSVANISIISDANPAGRDWAINLRRRRA